MVDAISSDEYTLKKEEIAFLRNTLINLKLVEDFPGILDPNFLSNFLNQERNLTPQSKSSLAQLIKNINQDLLKVKKDIEDISLKPNSNDTRKSSCSTLTTALNSLPTSETMGVIKNKLGVLKSSLGNGFELTSQPFLYFPEPSFVDPPSFITPNAEVFQYDPTQTISSFYESKQYIDYNFNNLVSQSINQSDDFIIGQGQSINNNVSYSQNNYDMSNNFELYSMSNNNLRTDGFGQPSDHLNHQYIRDSLNLNISSIPLVSFPYAIDCQYPINDFSQENESNLIAFNYGNNVNFAPTSSMTPVAISSFPLSVSPYEGTPVSAIKIPSTPIYNPNINRRNSTAVESYRFINGIPSVPNTPGFYHRKFSYPCIGMSHSTTNTPILAQNQQQQVIQQRNMEFQNTEFQNENNFKASSQIVINCPPISEEPFDILGTKALDSTNKAYNGSKSVQKKEKVKKGKKKDSQNKGPDFNKSLSIINEVFENTNISEEMSMVISRDSSAKKGMSHAELLMMNPEDPQLSLNVLLKEGSLGSKVVPALTKSNWGNATTIFKQPGSVALPILNDSLKYLEITATNLNFPLICPYPTCQSMCGNLSSIRKHVLTHNAQRPFSCTDCPSMFRRRQDLIRHMKIHLKMKPFSCGRCNKKFGRKDAQVRHTKKATCRPRIEDIAEESAVN